MMGIHSRKFQDRMVEAGTSLNLRILEEISRKAIADWDGKGSLPPFSVEVSIGDIHITIGPITIREHR